MEQLCPQCNSPMWDNRQNKKNPKAPDFKCKNQGCGHAIWPPKQMQRPAGVPPYQGKPLTPPRFDIQEKILEQLQQTHILLEKIGGLLAKAVGEKKEEYNEEEYDRPF